MGPWFDREYLCVGRFVSLESSSLLMECPNPHAPTVSVQRRKSCFTHMLFGRKNLECFPTLLSFHLRRAPKPGRRRSPSNLRSFLATFFNSNSMSRKSKPQCRLCSLAQLGRIEYTPRLLCFHRISQMGVAIQSASFTYIFPLNLMYCSINLFHFLSWHLSQQLFCPVVDVL